MSDEKKLSSWWANLSPQAKRIVVISIIGGGILLLAFGSDSFFTPKEKAHKSDKEVVRNVLTEADTRKLGIDALSAQVQKLRREINDLSDTVSRNIKDQDSIRRSRNGEVDKQLTDLKKELRDMRDKNDNFRSRVESGAFNKKPAAEKTTTERPTRESKTTTTKDRDKEKITSRTKEDKSAGREQTKEKEKPKTKTRERAVRNKDGKIVYIRETVPAATNYGNNFGSTKDSSGISTTSELFSAYGKEITVTNEDGELEVKEVAEPNIPPATVNITTSAGQVNASEDLGEAIESDLPPLRISVINGAPSVEEKQARAEKIREKTKEKDKDIEFYMPTGSIISAMLLNGIDASTSTGAKQEPMPALLRVEKDAILPNRYSSDIKDCFVLVSGHGDLSSERAYLRGEYLSCVRNDGGVLETKFPSYVVGEDGKAGMRGRLVSKQGTLIARTLVAGFASGVSKAFDVTPVSVLDTSSIGGSVQYQNNFNSGLMRGAAAQGASQALEKVADFYLKMAEQIFPVVEITAGRQINLIVTNGTKLKLKNVNELDGQLPTLKGVGLQKPEAD